MANKRIIDLPQIDQLNPEHKYMLGNRLKTIQQV
jgi:hypothetical protein